MDYMDYKGYKVRFNIRENLQYLAVPTIAKVAMLNHALKLTNDKDTGVGIVQVGKNGDFNQTWEILYQGKTIPFRVNPGRESNIPIGIVILSKD